MSTRSSYSAPVRSDSYDTIVPKKGSKSQIWGYFGLPADGDGNIIDPGVAVCNTCRREVGCKGGSTSNMRSHIRNHHSNLFKQILTAERGRSKAVSVFASSPSTSQSLKRIKKEALTTADKTLLTEVDWDEDADLRDDDDTCTKALIRLLVADDVPLNLIDKPNFRYFVRCLNRNYQMPDQKYFVDKAIPELYRSTVDKIRRLVSAHLDYVAITCECWALLSGQSFVALTAHFLDADFELVSVCLNCSRFLKDSLTLEVVELLRRILDQWGVRISHVTACTVGVHRVMSEAVQCLNVHRVPCFGSSLGSSLNRALELTDVLRSLTRLRKLHCALSQNFDLTRNIDDTDNVTGFQLPSESLDNWRSTLSLCRSFLENQPSITNILHKSTVHRHLLPDSVDWSTVEALTSVLKPLEELAGHISGDSNLIASSVIPLYHYITQLLKISDDESPTKLAIKEAVMEAMNACYGSSQDLKSLLELCTFCDPRYRLQFFKNDDQDRIREEVCKTAIRLNTPAELNEQSANFDLSLLWPANDCAGGETNETSSSSTKNKKGIASLLEKFVSESGNKAVNNESRSVEDRVEEELTRFLQMPAVTLDSNPLQWWKTNAALFPLFQKMAKKYLVVQGSSVSADSMFGTDNESFRNTLCSKNAEMQVFLTRNKKFIHVEN